MPVYGDLKTMSLCDLLQSAGANQKTGILELERQVAAKAEETIQGLFDWEDAVFRFHEGATLEPNQIAVSLSVEDVLLNGKSDVRSILWVAPLREVDVLRTLRLMLDKRLIELRAGEAGEAGGGSPDSPAVVESADSSPD